MLENQTNSKRIARNTMMLYFRSIVVMLISIYSSRVLLSTLGVEDFGLYNVVGGVVGIFVSIKSVLASAVQRFLNFEKGKGNPDNVRKIFNMSVHIHLCIALVFCVVVEIFGVWYINNHLVIPEGHLNTALFVFHCSIAASMLAIYTIPYDAVVIANERMSFYAWQSIIDISLKLIAIFMLPLLPYERIRSYAVLILVIAVVIRLVSVFYSKRFPECKKLKCWDINMFKELMTFAGWNFLGCITYSLVEEGSNLIINSFGGVVANAARSISYQIRSALMTVSNNILVASQPFITQQAATVDKEKFWNYIFGQARLMYYILLITGLPIYIFAEHILKIWLTDIPDYSVEFVKAIVIYVIVMSIQKSLDLSFKAYNKMALYQIVDACILFLTFPLIYLVLKYGYPLYSAFLVFSIIRILDYVAVLFVARYKIGLSLRRFSIQVGVPIVKGAILFILITALSGLITIPFGFINTIIGCALLLVVITILTYIFCFMPSEKFIVKEIVKQLKDKIVKTSC